MHPADRPPPDAPRVPLIPLGVADELVRVLIEIRNCSRDLECRDSGSGQEAWGVNGPELAIATRLILADLDHCMSLGIEKGQQVSARRWESILEDLRNLKRKLDAES